MRASPENLWARLYLTLEAKLGSVRFTKVVLFMNVWRDLAEKLRLDTMPWTGYW